LPSAAQAGDVIEIDAADYVETTPNGREQPHVAGVARCPHLRSTRLIDNGSGLANGKGIGLPQAQNVVVENIEFSARPSSDKNARGIRNEPTILTVATVFPREQTEFSAVAGPC